MRSLRTLVGTCLARLLLAVLLLTPAMARADDAADQAAALDRLFAELRVAPNPASAQAIDQQIWTIWTTPVDPVLAGRMDEVLGARGQGNLPGALRLLDELVADFPDYAEGWNQRATMHYMLGDYDASIADCARVLELEPRHFGALAGRALMYLSLGQRVLALKDMRAATALHPFLNERMLFPELMQDMTRI